MSTERLLNLVLMPEAYRTTFLHTYRPDCVRLSKSVLVRDQRPMPPAPPGSLRTPRTASNFPSDWYAFLNGHVFFWPDRGRMERQQQASGGRPQPLIHPRRRPNCLSSSSPRRSSVPSIAASRVLSVLSELAPMRPVGPLALNEILLVLEPLLLQVAPRQLPDATGSVDLAFMEETPEFAGWTVVDFKTDREFATSSDRYKAQVTAYSDAQAAAASATCA